MKMANDVVVRLLQSRASGVLSSSTCLVRYRGRRSGREVTTPAGFARLGAEVVIRVGHADKKIWWRNFEAPHELELLLPEGWVPMVGLVERDGGRLMVRCAPRSLTE